MSLSISQHEHEINRKIVDAEERHRLAQNSEERAKQYDDGDARARADKQEAERYKAQAAIIEAEIEAHRREMEALKKQADALEDARRKEQAEHDTKMVNLDKQIRDIRGGI